MQLIEFTKPTHKLHKKSSTFCVVLPSKFIIVFSMKTHNTHTSTQVEENPSAFFGRQAQCMHKVGACEDLHCPLEY